MIVLIINYAAEPLITPAVMQMVEDICKECLGEQAANFSVVFSPGLAPKNKLGHNGGFLKPATEFNVNLDNTLGSSLGANGQTGGWSSNLCPANIRSSAQNGGGNLDATTANTIAHEIGHHMLGGSWFHFCSDDKPDSLDRSACTRELTRAPGHFSPNCCWNLKVGLGFVVQL